MGLCVSLKRGEEDGRIKEKRPRISLFLWSKTFWWGEKNANNVRKFKGRTTGWWVIEREREKETCSKRSVKEACGEMHHNLLPLSAGLTLIHWSRDRELSAQWRPGVLWSICRVVLLIVGIHSECCCPVTTAPHEAQIWLPSYVCRVFYQPCRCFLHVPELSVFV